MDEGAEAEGAEAVYVFPMGHLTYSNIRVMFSNTPCKLYISIYIWNGYTVRMSDMTKIKSNIGVDGFSIGCNLEINTYLFMTNAMFCHLRYFLSKNATYLIDYQSKSYLNDFAHIFGRVTSTKLGQYGKE